MATAVQGKKIIYKYRRLSQQAIEDAWNLGCVTENGRTLSVDADSTATKDGSIRTPGVPEQEITSTSVLVKDDPRPDEIEDAVKNGEKFEIWEINLERPVDGAEGKYHGIYYQGYGTNFELSSNAEDMSELSLTFGLEGKGARGECTVTAEEEEQASYAFEDTPKKTGTSDGGDNTGA